MKSTCGIFLINPKREILAVHATNAPDHIWGIPKGLRHEGEKTDSAALREFFEETGQVLFNHPGKFGYIGDFVYRNKKKLLHAYYYTLKKNIEIEEFVCNSLVNGDFPEVDAFKWIPFRDIEILHHTQQEALVNLNWNSKIWQKGKDISKIPNGDYCYKTISVSSEGRQKIDLCPYWDSVDDKPQQLNGYCGFLEMGDWMDGGPFLLWDQCKECGIRSW